jgi:K(+)-stimulated pyrophosphate-energized sodium pump
VVEVATAQMLDFSQAYNLTVLNPQLLCGIFIGAMMAFVFCAMTMKAVGRAAGAMVNEVRRQFREIAGIMEGTGTPDYANCVAISTKGAQREMMIPSLLAIIVPVIVGIILGVSGVIGLLVGGLTTGFTLACMLNNAGGAWDNAKKSIEKQEKTYADDDKEKAYPLTGKGSETHKAGVVGDTVGDPFKDTSGPSLNILIKLMTMVSVVFSGVIVAYGDQLKVLVDFLTKK